MVVQFCWHFAKDPYLRPAISVAWDRQFLGRLEICTQPRQPPRKVQPSAFGMPQVFVVIVSMTALACIPSHQLLVVGDASGRLHWLALPSAAH